MDSLDNIVRRIDYELRNKIIGLKTEIYRVENFKHVIVPLNNKNNLDEIKKTLEKIRIMGVFLKIVDGNEVEGKKIQSFENGDIVSDFKGLVYNDEGLWNFLTSRFHKIDFKDLKYEHDPKRKFVVKISDKTSEEKIKELEKFITSTVQFGENNEIKKVSSTLSPRIRYEIDRKYECKKKGSEFWFENASKIYKGELKKDEISFFNKNTTKCFFNASVFQNIDIRNLILLYDEIYLEPPIRGKIEDFFRHQNISEDEFIELSNKGKFKLMLTNEKVGYDKRSFDAINSNSPNSMWDEKMVNSILACDFVEMEKKFFLTNMEDHTKIELIKLLLKNGFPKELLLWPLKVKNESFRLFNAYGKMGLGNISIHKMFESDIKKIQGKKDLMFELMINAPNIHLANSLEATYFPFSSTDGKYSDAGVSNILGSALNVFKNPNESYNSIVANIKKCASERESINFLNLRDGISISDVFENSAKGNTTKHLKDFLIELENLDLNEQQDKIRNINNTIYQFHEGRNMLETVFDYSLTGASFGPPQVSVPAMILSALKIFYKKSNLSEKKKIEKIYEEISKNKLALNELESIHCFSKIDRIANLKLKNC